ncbi:organic hydroperoxide resistance protein [Kibdelosporangium phytohabitans]|uniref:Organic hydroperoxide resistance protein n=1 Tax=Kibdelosporangium phytohabitans TaxID=860235 RepID=A0A0N9HIK2_9PSEU|nr:organic hydroperoxide resistance protein [Kibdelosporangium phytohabitans]ALG05765.1 organic hydroperoxide resistance protein [Kibdelosporangium phytohabitans]MBE1466235.1 Ohr subfamily peroxiredoxin [Kibdelosporangium phytohabitans]
MAQALYTAEATSTGDGRNGEVVSSDGVIDEKLATPKEMGGQGGEHTNPEQLFAAGYSACFHSALRLVARQTKAEVGETAVTASVTLNKDDSGRFVLSVTLKAHLPGIEQGMADQLVAQAHQVCPYSHATRGNIEVTVIATV